MLGNESRRGVAAPRGSREAEPGYVVTRQARARGLRGTEAICELRRGFERWRRDGEICRAAPCAGARAAVAPARTRAPLRARTRAAPSAAQPLPFCPAPARY